MLVALQLKEIWQYHLWAVRWLWSQEANKQMHALQSTLEWSRLHGFACLLQCFGGLLVLHQLCSIYSIDSTKPRRPNRIVYVQLVINLVGVVAEHRCRTACQEKYRKKSCCHLCRTFAGNWQSLLNVSIPPAKTIEAHQEWTRMVRRVSQALRRSIDTARDTWSSELLANEDGTESTEWTKRRYIRQTSQRTEIRISSRG